MTLTKMRGYPSGHLAGKSLNGVFSSDMCTMWGPQTVCVLVYTAHKVHLFAYYKSELIIGDGNQLGYRPGAPHCRYTGG